MPIPRKLHFVYLAGEDSGAQGNIYARSPFCFVHYMAIKSAQLLNPGFEIYFHCDRAPQGPHWDELKSQVILSPVAQPTEVFGRPIAHIAHRSDVLRLTILRLHGGIYLDLDTICQKPPICWAMRW